MAVFYFDSSAVVKRYVAEMGTAWVRATLDPTLGHVAYVSAIAAVEVVSAIARRRSNRSITTADAKQALSDFQFDIRRQYRVVDLTEKLIEQAAALADQHALRGYDAVHLACVLEVKAAGAAVHVWPTLVCADVELNAAASAEGLPVEDPNNHPRRRHGRVQFPRNDQDRRSRATALFALAGGGSATSPGLT